MRAHRWPGNVRELEATIEGLLQMTEKSVLTLADLPRQPWWRAIDGLAGLLSPVL